MIQELSTSELYEKLHDFNTADKLVASIYLNQALPDPIITDYSDIIVFRRGPYEFKILSEHYYELLHDQVLMIAGSF